MKVLVVTQDFGKFKKGDLFKDPQGKKLFQSQRKAELYASSYSQLKLMDLPQGYDEQTYEVICTEAQPEKWTKAGEADKSVQPTVTFWEKDGVKVYEEPSDSTGYDVSTEVDDSYTHVPAVQEAFSIEENTSKVSSKRQSKANSQLDALRAARKSKLEDADYLVFKAEDAQEDASALRTYRIALRSVTEEFKKQDGEAKLATESLDVESFDWPAKP